MPAFAPSSLDNRSVILSLVLHAIAILLLAMRAPTYRPETSPLLLSANVQQETRPELEFLQIDVVAEPPPDASEPATVIPTVLLARDLNQLQEASLVAFGGGIGSRAVAEPDLIARTAITQRLLSARMTAGIISMHNGLPAADCRSELRRELRESAAYEIALINPGQIFSIAYFPLGDLDSQSQLSVSNELRRQEVFEWVTRNLSESTVADFRQVSPNPDLILLASAHRLPMKELRDIAWRYARTVPVYVVGLELDRGSAADLKNLAALAGGAYFGID